MNTLKIFVKKLLIPFLKLKWQNDSLVKQWLSESIFKEGELEILLFEWQKFGDVKARPHIIKQRLIQKYKHKYNCEVFVETGTYMGDMIAAQLNHFNKLYSIELSDILYQKALKRFAENKNVKLLFGDSGKELKSLVPEINETALFWLDGHYCGGVTAKSEIECPIYDELNTIFNTTFKHIILIDDARYFIGERDYPTIPELTKFVEQKGLGYTVSIEDDAIVIEKRNI